nr:GGDEF domain-containing protein [Candidatus Cloacimonadota bacterium]
EQVETLLSDIEIKHEIDKAETTEKLVEVTKTAEEKQMLIEKLETESDDKDQLAKLQNESKNKQIEKLQYERKIYDLNISKQKRLRNIYFFVLIASIVLLVLLVLLVIIVLVLSSKYKMKKKHSMDMEKMAKTDPLTQLPNRRAVLDQISYEAVRFKRNSEPFTIIISDIDNFKDVNDKYGHAAGDKALITLSNLINKTIRKQDICARWGGEEFLFLLPGTDNKGSKIITEKIRRKIEKEKIEYKGYMISITMTFGICSFSKSITTDECISRADKALYEGKKLGKNRIVSFKKSFN